MNNKYVNILISIKKKFYKNFIYFDLYVRKFYYKI